MHWQRHLSSAEDYTNMSYYNLCGIRSQHSNISEGKKGGGWGTSQVCKTPIIKIDTDCNNGIKLL
jgi:hypothetical protein